jgi:hypothetical protein
MSRPQGRGLSLGAAAPGRAGILASIAAVQHGQGKSAGLRAVVDLQGAAGRPK